jgi:hypothetical protein
MVAVFDARWPILSSFLSTTIVSSLRTRKAEMPRWPGVGVRLGVDREEVGVAAVRDEALRAVEDVLVAPADGAGAHARDVGARVGLGQAEGGEPGLLEELAVELLEHLVGGAELHGRGGQAVGAQRGRDARAAPGQLLLDDAAVEEAEAGPPKRSGTWVFIRPTSWALRMTSMGQVPSRSYSQATGRISFSAKSCASSRRAFCSSVSVKSTTALLGGTAID